MIAQNWRQISLQLNKLKYNIIIHNRFYDIMNDRCDKLRSLSFVHVASL